MNAALAIYRTQNSAHNVVQASPIHFHLQQGKDGWISKISRDASAEGSLPTSTEDEDQAIKTTEEAFEDSSSLDPNYHIPQDEEPKKDAPFQPSYAQNHSSGAAPGAHNGPGDKWEREILTTAVRKDKKAPDDHKSAPLGTLSSDLEPPQTFSRDTINKPNKKSARQLADQLSAETTSFSRSPKASKDRHTSPPVQEFQLTVVKSLFDHQAYIERQGYYAGFNPNMKTIMAEDLKGRVPLEGFLDCSLTKKDVPLRIRLKRKEQPCSQISLRELWEAGKRERGET